MVAGQVDLQVPLRVYVPAMVMRIGELARRTGLAPSALRYYEDAGMLAAAARSKAGSRLFGEEAAGRPSFIKRAQALGLTIRKIRDLINGPTLTAEEDRDRLRHLIAHKLDETDHRLQELEELRRQLEARPTSACCEPRRPNAGTSATAHAGHQTTRR